jgi:hypothetical protein
MFQDATTQKKRFARWCVITLVQRYRDRGRFGDHDWIDARLLDLAGQKHCYHAVVVLIIGIMMYQFMQTWTDYQSRSPLEHRNQKQRDDPRSGGCAEIPSGVGVFGFSFSVHETP